MSFILCLLQKETVTKALWKINCGAGLWIRRTQWFFWNRLWIERNLSIYGSENISHRNMCEKDILENKQDSLSTIKYKYTYKLKYVIMYLYIISCINLYNVPMCTHRCIWYVLQCTYIPTYNHPNFWSVYMHIYTCTCLYYIYHHICSYTFIYMCVYVAVADILSV